MLNITLSNQIFLKKSEVDEPLLKFLKSKLVFINSEYLIKKKIGKSIYGVNKFFEILKELKETYVIPRGFMRQLTDFCLKQNIAYTLIDQRKIKSPLEYTCNIELYDYQQNALAQAEKKNFGIIVAPPGSGKTVMGLKLIADKCQPALILVHRKQLLEQWVERIQNFLKIPKSEIGQISGNKKKIGTHITVAMMQSLIKKDTLKKTKDHFGLILIDECHHIPAKTFRKIIVHFNSYYMYGLTATPIRKYNDEKLIFYYIGNILSQIEKTDTTTQDKQPSLQLVIRETSIKLPFDYKFDHFEILSKVLTYDSTRNQMIVEDITSQIKAGKKILVLTERKEHVEILYLYLKDSFEIIPITGDDNTAAKKTKLEQIKAGDFQVMISTGQFFGEGMDISHLDCLFLVYPFSFEGKLKQYIGRIERAKTNQIIFDYHDKDVLYLDRMFQKRAAYYKKIIIK